MGLLLGLFRRSERWLHQHIFKVGWLLTNNFQTTTIFYYILFLPGILLREFTRWLAASLLHLKPARAIGFPQPQEIGELRLNFIRVSAPGGSIRYALINVAPLVTGLGSLWLIATRVLSGRTSPFSQALATLTICACLLPAHRHGRFLALVLPGVHSGKHHVSGDAADPKPAAEDRVGGGGWRAAARRLGAR